MQKYTNNVQDSSGNAQPGYQITVTNAGTGVAVTIYSDNGITPTTNPITADSTGTFSFYAPNGRYTLNITGLGAASRTLSDIVLFDPADAGAVAASKVSFTPTGTIASTDAQAAIVEVTTDLSATTGATLVGASDGSSGSLWTTVQGFINKIISSSGASAIGGVSQVVDSIAGLRALLKTSFSKRAFVTGYYTAGDGGGGTYWYDPTDTTSADNGGTIIVATDGGRRKLANSSLGVSVRQFGAKGDGTTNDTAAFQALVNWLASLNGGTMWVPNGTYLLDSVVFPYDPVVINMIGAGMETTILLMNNPLNPVITMSRAIANQRMTGSTFSDFAVKANATGSYLNTSHIAIDTVGFDHVIFRRIKFLSNGTGSCYCLFRTAASPQLSYSQTFEGISIWGQTGPAYGLSTQNNGLGVLYNTNIISVRDSWFYNNTNMTACLDMSNCTQYTIINNEFESTANYGVILGNQGTLMGNWFEAQATAPIQFQNTASVPSSNNTILGNYFSGFNGAFSIPTNCNGNIFENNFGGTFTLSAAAGVTKLVVGGIANTFGSAPTITKTFGPAGTLTFSSATLVGYGENTWQLVYTFAPGTGATQYGFTVAVGTGVSIVRVVPSVYDGGSGVPYVVALGTGNQFFVTAPNINTFNIIVNVTVN